MDKPIQIGYVFPGNILGRAMEIMEQLLNTEMRSLLQLELRQIDYISRTGDLASTALAPSAKAMLMHRYQSDLDLVTEAFGVK